MNCRSRKMRSGISLTEVVVAAVLIISIIGLLTPLTVRVGRVWQTTRQYRLAFHELANQMEYLTSQSVASCMDALPSLQPSAIVSESLPGAQMSGEMLRDQDGTRLVLKLDWDRGGSSVPLSLVGWLDTDPIDPVSSEQSTAQKETKKMETATQNGVLP